MPTSPAGPCSVPGCAGRSWQKSGRCEQHQRQARAAYDRARGSFRERGYRSDWDRLRARILRAEPLCRQCGIAATDVHHDPPFVAGTRHEDYSLVPLCHRCHSTITSRQVR